MYILDNDRQSLFFNYEVSRLLDMAGFAQDYVSRGETSFRG